MAIPPEQVPGTCGGNPVSTPFGFLRGDTERIARAVRWVESQIAGRTGPIGAPRVVQHAPDLYQVTAVAATTCTLRMLNAVDGTLSADSERTLVPFLTAEKPSVGQRGILMGIGDGGAVFKRLAGRIEYFPAQITGQSGAGVYAFKEITNVTGTWADKAGGRTGNATHAGTDFEVDTGHRVLLMDEAAHYHVIFNWAVLDTVTEAPTTAAPTTDAPTTPS